MDFRTSIPTKPLSFTLSHADRVLVLGSCFAESIGHQLIDGGFNAMVNPFGVLYNPASVGMALERLRTKQLFLEHELVEQEGWYHSFSHHGSFSGTDLNKTLDSINKSFNQAVGFLAEATCLILTFGTAWVYTLPSTDQIVANCHKFPESFFERRRLSVDEIVLYYEDLLEDFHQINPNLKVLFTVSPIRHWKDGAHENTISKSTLHLSIEALCEAYDQVDYYPSYELLMDELRDYRFYADDMLHPSPLAQQYIWEHFSESLFSKSTREIVHQVRQIRKAMLHKPFHPDSDDYFRFAKKNIAAIELLLLKSPILDLTKERMFFEKILSTP